MLQNSSRRHIMTDKLWNLFGSLRSIGRAVYGTINEDNGRAIAATPNLPLGEALTASSTNTMSSGRTSEQTAWLLTSSSLSLREFFFSRVSTGN